MMAGEYGFLSLFLLPCDLLVVEAHVQQQAAPARDGLPPALGSWHTSSTATNQA